MYKQITLLVLFYICVISLPAQISCDGKLNEEHWYYKELQTGEFRDNMTLLSAQPNSIFPDSLAIQFFSPKELDGQDELELINKIILKEYSCLLEMIDEQPLYKDSIESIRMIKNYSVFRVQLLNDKCYLSLKKFDGVEMIEQCKEILSIDFEYLKKRIYKANFFKTPTFPIPDIQKYGAIMDGDFIIVEAKIDGHYHLVSMSNLFDYMPEFNRINLWFMGTALNFKTSNKR